MIVKGAVVQTVLFILSLLVIYYSIIRSEKGEPPKLRTIPAILAFEELIGRASEMGRPVNFDFGRPTLTVTSRAPQTVAAIACMSHVARLCAAIDVPFYIATNTQDALPAFQAAVDDAYAFEGKPSPSDAIQWLGSGWGFDQRWGTWIEEKRIAANFLIGTWWAETVYHVEHTKRVGAMAIGGDSSVGANLAVLVAGCDYAIVGEELFAAGAYLSKDKTQIGSLYGQDILKLLIAVFAVVSIILQLVGVDVVSLLST